MRVGALIVAGFALCASQAQAQSVEANAAAAQALIDRAGVADLFQVLQDDSIALRHGASGLVCHFFPGDTREELIVFEGLPRGDDVGCARDEEHSASTLYATRYIPAISTRQALAEAEAGIRQRFPDARPSPASLVMSSEGLPPTLVSHFLISVRGERWVTSAIVAQSGDWIIKLRYSARALDADELMQAELLANAMMATTLMHIVDPTPSAP